MITRLLDWWWDAQITRARRRRRIDVHRHYRDGHDCSQCDCRTYHPERITP